MTKSTEKEAKKEEVQQPTASDKPAEQAAAPQAQQQRIEVDDSTAQVCYANFCRVNGTPEELIIDFGLNSQPFGTPEKPLAVSQRLVVNYYTAKRLMGALQLSVQRHEAAFGVLETNVQKRVVPAAMRQGGQS
jgi:hypothetical protein